MYRHVSHLQRGNYFIALLIGAGGDGVARVAVWVDDGVAPLPADDDGILPPGGTVQFLVLTLYSHGGVRVGCYHGWNCTRRGCKWTRSK